MSVAVTRTILRILRKGLKVAHSSRIARQLWSQHISIHLCNRSRQLSAYLPMSLGNLLGFCTVTRESEKLNEWRLAASSLPTSAVFLIHSSTSQWINKQLGKVECCILSGLNFLIMLSKYYGTCFCFQPLFLLCEWYSWDCAFFCTLVRRRFVIHWRILTLFHCVVCLKNNEQHSKPFLPCLSHCVHVWEE